MRKRLNGQILRGTTVYYTFQRFQTGLGYLNRAETKGEDPESYRVTYTYDSRDVEQSARDFRKVAPKLIESQAKNGHKVKQATKLSAKNVKTMTGRGAKIKLTKQKVPAKRKVNMNQAAVG